MIYRWSDKNSVVDVFAYEFYHKGECMAKMTNIGGVVEKQILYDSDDKLK